MVEGPEIRLSDADRDAVVQQLSAAMAEGRVDVTEFEQRSRAAYAARIPSELSELTADLPPRAPMPAPPDPSAKAPSIPPSTRWAISIFGDRRIEPARRKGERTVAVSIFGDQVLDLRDLHAPDSELMSVSVFGDLKVAAPDDVEIDLNGFALFGDFPETRNPVPASATRFVRIRSFRVFGDTRITRV